MNANTDTSSLRILDEGDTTGGMRPLIPKWAVITLDIEEVPVSGKVVIVKRGTEFISSRLLKENDKTYLVPENKDHEKLELLPSDAICGVVKKMVVSLVADKKIHVNLRRLDEGYRDGH